MDQDDLPQSFHPTAPTALFVESFRQVARSAADFRILEVRKSPAPLRMGKIQTAILGRLRPAVTLHVRNALYMGAVSQISRNSPSGAHYRRLVREGKKPKIASTAVMRKLVILANTLITGDRHWQPVAPSLQN